MENMKVWGEICWILAGVFSGISILLWVTLHIDRRIRRRKRGRKKRKHHGISAAVAVGITFFVIFQSEAQAAAVVTPFPVSSFGGGKAQTSGRQSSGTETSGTQTSGTETAGTQNSGTASEAGGGQTNQRVSETTPAPVRIEGRHTQSGTSGRKNTDADQEISETRAGQTGDGRTANDSGSEESGTGRSGVTEGAGEMSEEELFERKQSRMVQANRNHAAEMRRKEEEQKKAVVQAGAEQRRFYDARRQRLRSETQIIGAEDGEVLTQAAEITVVPASEVYGYLQCRQQLTVEGYRKQAGRVTAFREEIRGRISPSGTERFSVSEDGCYTLLISYALPAGQTEEVSRHFTVNRHGSLFQEGKSLQSLREAWEPAAQTELLMEEYNPCPLRGETIVTEVTRDGEPVSPSGILCQREQMENGWWRCRRLIRTDALSEEGTYRVLFTSEDLAGNYSESEKVLFHIDRKPPELMSLKLSEPDGAEREAWLSAVIFDSGGISAMRIYKDGRLLWVCTFPKNDAGGLWIRLPLLDRGQRMEAVDRCGNKTQFSCAKKDFIKLNFALDI